MCYCVLESNTLTIPLESLLIWNRKQLVTEHPSCSYWSKTLSWNSQYFRPFPGGCISLRILCGYVRNTKQYPNHNHAASDVKTVFRLLHTLHDTVPCLTPFAAHKKIRKKNKQNNSVCFLIPMGMSFSSHGWCQESTRPNCLLVEIAGYFQNCLKYSHCYPYHCIWRCKYIGKAREVVDSQHILCLTSQWVHSSFSKNRQAGLLMKEMHVHYVVNWQVFQSPASLEGIRKFAFLS